MCSFMPKYHCWPLRVWCISGSLALSAFCVELGAPMTLSQGDDLFLERAIAVLRWLVAVGAGAHANDAQCTPLAQTLVSYWSGVWWWVWSGATAQEANHDRRAAVCAGGRQQLLRLLREGLSTPS